VLVYREENQRLAYWGVPTVDSDHPDPAVLWAEGPGDPGTWQPYLDRLSLALLEHVLAETIVREGGYSYFADIRDQDVAEAMGRLTRLAIPEHVHWPKPEAGPVQWFAASPDVIVRNDGGRFLLATSREPLTEDDLANLVPVEWEEMGE